MRWKRFKPQNSFWSLSISNWLVATFLIKTTKKTMNFLLQFLFFVQATCIHRWIRMFSPLDLRGFFFFVCLGFFRQNFLACCHTSTRKKIYRLAKTKYKTKKKNTTERQLHSLLISVYILYILICATLFFSTLSTLCFYWVYY